MYKYYYLSKLNNYFYDVLPSLFPKYMCSFVFYSGSAIKQL